MQEITIEASNVWEYFQQHKEELKHESHVIAERDEYGVIITLTEEHGLPCFSVTADYYPYEERSAVSETDCTKTVEELYDRYLTEKFLTYGDEFDEVSTNNTNASILDQEDMISEREMELDDAVILLLDTVFEEDLSTLGTDMDEICEDVKDHIIEYLARKYGLSIRRPMILEDDETGEDFFTEHPYECMVFDDEDNPVYKK